MSAADNLNLFRTLYDASPNAVAILKIDAEHPSDVKTFNIQYLNPRFRDEYSIADYPDLTASDIVPMFARGTALDQIADVALTGIPSRFVDSLQTAGGARWLRYEVSRQDDFLIVSTYDISDVRKVETVLENAMAEAEKQRRLYESITSNTPDLVYVFDLNYRFTYANKALLEMWGKTAAEAIGKGLRENGYEEWHAEMHEREIDEVAATKKNVRGTVSFPHAELGERVYDYILVPVLNEAGEVEVVAGTTRDITELKESAEKIRQSESRLKMTIDQTPAPTLVLMGDRLVIEQINKPMLEMIGHGEEVIGLPLIEVLPELKGSYIWEQVVKVYDDGITFDHPEVCVSHTRGGEIEDFYYNLSYRPLRDAGEIVGMIQVAVDVTAHVLARKKLEESENRYRKLSETLELQVEQRTQELQRSNDDLQQFAHVASHDLKEPVRKIKMFVSRLEEKIGRHRSDADGSLSQFIEKINGATDRMYTMIEGVLGYSTVSSNSRAPERVDLDDIVNNIEVDLEVALQNTSGKIIHDGLPTIEGAPVLLYQLFYNLINNSLKFARPGVPPRISITSRMSEEAVDVEVTDNGIGFENSQSSYIFETFRRLHSKDQYDGTGLGLALCKKIVERHRGTISATGRPGDGATFSIRLPLKQHEAI
ncbi:PAS domain-containing sensor histidine kinase [Flavobacterium selenitireducens]|uniref:PAS domain-containing sensor histidine kinase n=1 Tax=Flavobacterium selenitireducens TaxID=2722704 RepID=UPI00168B859B|nr:PAS domain-containing sensor histidine kinase [Flavobacterium selenitireducens]MBD3583560.1 PAS domain-containing protein [Flavobacterium selenitireducens]